jgi:3-hydroxyisobutyrate dehydrogenase
MRRKERAQGGIMTKVGFIGTGTMGRPMSGNLVKRGFDVTLYDQDTARAAEVGALWGCKAVPSLAGLGDREFIVTMLPDGKAVADVLTRAQNQALIKSCRPGTIFIDMSSSEPLITRETGAALKKHGMVLVDAPVSGTRTRAESASLTIMIGCSDESLVEKVRLVLSAMGNQLFVVGGLGTGHAMKSLNNYLAAAALTAASEALIIGEKFGLDPKVMIDVLNTATGRSFVTEVVMKDHVLTGKFASGFAIGLLAKDVRIAADLGEAIEIEAPVSRLVRERLAFARDKLGATRDTSEAFLAFKQQNA